MTPPSTGYSIESIHTVQARYRVRLPGDEACAEERDINFLWDWRFVEPRRFEVMLAAKVGPCEKACDEMEAFIVGTFAVVGALQSVDLRGFVELNAPALLMPYLRQALTSLSDHGPLGPFYLPQINVKVLSEGFDHDAATGVGQLEEDSSLIGSGSEVSAG